MNTSIAQNWQHVQATLFPILEPIVGPLTPKHQELITVLDFINPNRFIKYFQGLVGRPEKDRAPFIRAFIFKMIAQCPTTRALIDRLKCDITLRRICGWESRCAIPSEATFSRAFAEFSATELPSRIMETFVKEYHADRIIGHVSRDSTAIEAREKVDKEWIKKKKQQKQEAKNKPKFKRGRPKKDEVRPPPDPAPLERQASLTLSQMLEELPNKCDIGCKKNAKGFTETWKGYKCHIDTIDGDIPVSCILTSASMHDSMVGLPLSQITAKKLPNTCYELMDAAYDAQVIRDYISSNGRVPLIDFNHRGPKDQRCFAPHEAQRYKQRSSAERANSQLKDNYGGCHIRVRGAAKVLCHLTFGLLVIAVVQTIRLIT